MDVCTDISVAGVNRLSFGETEVLERDLINRLVEVDLAEYFKRLYPVVLHLDELQGLVGRKERVE